jgi:hypothetical protein
MAHGLSKSRIVNWKQCPKRLWLQIHHPELQEFSQGSERSFQNGYEVGETAQRLYPNGILIDNANLADCVTATHAAMQAHPDATIFEATFQHQGVLIRADILHPTPNGYRMLEVKSSTSVKPYHIDDCAIQAYVIAQNNISLASVELMHIDTGFVYQGDGDYAGLFHYENLDEQIAALQPSIPNWISEARATLSGNEPEITPSEHCDDPYACPFKAHCNRNIDQPPETDYPLDVLHRMHQSTKDSFRASGIHDARHVPTELLNDTQQWIQRVSQSGQAELRCEAKAAMIDLPYPRYYLDFETITHAVPRWANTRPYATQVPFQWSCHIEDAAHQLEHHMFLDVSGNDPRRACAEQMIAALGSDGPIFVYYQAFEKSRIAELAELYPDLAADLHAINYRIVDLLPITRASYYHPQMHGSWSIKAVLPTIAPDLSYQQLLVGDGGAAQDAYSEIVHPDTTPERKLALTQGLFDYCTLDTLAMVRLAWFLQNISAY